MTTEFRRSQACCSTPAIIGPPYEAKGTWTELDGKKLYISGSAAATKAIFIIYDVFGYSSQILEGADILASKGYIVFMPDLFDGHPAPLQWMPMPDATGAEPPADGAAIDAFTEGPGETHKTVTTVLRLRSDLQTRYTTITRWGVVGYCWGGWVVNFLLNVDTPFRAGAQLHPGWPGKEQAEKVSRPLLALCSKDEPEREYVDFKPYLKVESHFEHFPTMLHGWMSARGDLAKPEVRKDFDRGYSMVADWFGRFV